MNAKSKYLPKNGILPTYSKNVPTRLMIITGCQVVISKATMQSSFRIKTVNDTDTIFGPSTSVRI